MVCSGAYPEAPRWPMLSTGASAGVLLAVAPTAAEPAITNKIPTKTIVNHNRRIFTPPISSLGQPHTETVVGRGLGRAHPELFGGLGEFAGYAGCHGSWRRSDGHLSLARYRAA